MKTLGLLLLTATLASLPAWAEQKTTTYRWVDEHGKVHYGDSIPASQADLGHKELDSMGRVRNQVERTRLNAAERQQRLNEELKRQEAKRKEAEENRHDSALLSTYVTAEEIDLARDRALALEEQQLKGVQSHLNRSLDKLARANKQLARLQVLDQRPPSGLVQMRDEANTEIKQYEAQLAQRQKIIAELKARYDADKKRYIELKERLKR